MLKSICPFLFWGYNVHEMYTDLIFLRVLEICAPVNAKSVGAPNTSPRPFAPSPFLLPKRWTLFTFFSHHSLFSLILQSCIYFPFTDLYKNSLAQLTLLEIHCWSVLEVCSWLLLSVSLWDDATVLPLQRASSSLVFITAPSFLLPFWKILVFLDRLLHCSLGLPQTVNLLTSASQVLGFSGLHLFPGSSQLYSAKALFHFPSLI